MVDKGFAENISRRGCPVGAERKVQVGEGKVTRDGENRAGIGTRLAEVNSRGDTL